MVETTSRRIVAEFPVPLGPRKTVHLALGDFESQDSTPRCPPKVLGRDRRDHCRHGIFLNRVNNLS